jgi:hypothetical protein
MKAAAVIAALIASCLLLPQPAHAQAGCPPQRIKTEDMAGLYISPESLMRITIFPCGGVHLLWQNEFGLHEMTYAVVERLPDGTFIAAAIAGTPGLDGRMNIGIKPAEPGYIQAFTASPFMTDLRVYHLGKVER